MHLLILNCSQLLFSSLPTLEFPQSKPCCTQVSVPSSCILWLCFYNLSKMMCNASPESFLFRNVRTVFHIIIRNNAGLFFGQALSVDVSYYLNSGGHAYLLQRTQQLRHILRIITLTDWKLIAISRYFLLPETALAYMLRKLPAKSGADLLSKNFNVLTSSYIAC